MSTPFEPGSYARSKRPANVRATGSAAPPEYSPLPSAPSPIYTHRSHAAQYGAGRRYGITIRAMILHTTEGESFTGSVGYNTWRPETVSSTAHAGPAGELAIEIDEANRPWTTGRWNDESITLEIVGRAAWSEAQWRARPLQLEAITRWLVDGCRRHKIPPVLLTAAEFAEGASRAGQSPLRAGSRRGIVDHRTANDAAIALGHDPGKYSHWDIGPGLRRVVAADIMPEVARRLGNPTIPPPSPITWTQGGTVLHTTTPKRRLVDTRKGQGAPTGRVEPGDPLVVAIPAPAGVDPKTAIVNVTIVNPAGEGHLQVDGEGFGDASDGNYAPGHPPTPCSTIADIVDGAIRVRLNRASAHVLVDLLGVVD